MDNILFNIIIALIPVILTVATYYGKGYINALKEKENLANLIVIARMAVRATEQVWNSYDSEIKKKKAMESLEKMGIDLTVEQMDILIESAVKELKAQGVIK